jgi:hypothetical protein
MEQSLTVDGRVLVPISPTTLAFVRAHLPRRPAEPGILWVGETCWIASYHDEAMRPEHFARWECLNPCEEPR